MSDVLLDEAQKQRDGRNIDPESGALAGEAAQQKVELLDRANPVVEYKLPVVSAQVQVRAESPTYYDRPTIKEPVWIPAVPAYFFVSGLAGASSALAFAAASLGGERMRRLSRDARWTGAIGDAIGAGLLTYDLGRPERVLHMLRVFRPTSPMSVGAWLLAASGALNGAAAVFGGMSGPLGRAADVAGGVGGVLGLPLSGYTAVLISNTAVPVWKHARKTLPYLFTASGASSAASLLLLLPRTPAEQRTLRTFAIAARIAEALASTAVEHEVGRNERVARPLERGLTGVMFKASKALNLASLVVQLLPGKARRKDQVAGAINLAGALLTRFSIFYAGKESARDPRATFEGQRQTPSPAGKLSATAT